jgi:hypothetical protein
MLGDHQIQRNKFINFIFSDWSMKIEDLEQLSLLCPNKTEISIEIQEDSTFKNLKPLLKFKEIQHLEIFNNSNKNFDLTVLTKYLKDLQINKLKTIKYTTFNLDIKNNLDYYSNLFKKTNLESFTRFATKLSKKESQWIASMISKSKSLSNLDLNCKSF